MQGRYGRGYEQSEGREPYLETRVVSFFRPSWIDRKEVGDEGLEKKGLWKRKLSLDFSKSRFENEGRAVCILLNRWFEPGAHRE